MTYGQLAGKKEINVAIYRCFEHICEEDVQKFVRKFRAQYHDEDQVMDTFRELILGAYLGSNGFRVRYEQSVGTRTPDWCILDETLTLRGVVELVNFHAARATENEMEAQVQARGMSWVWPGSSDDRLYASIWGKAGTYKALVELHQVPYVIAVFGGFKAAVDLEEMHECLFDKESGLFVLYPEISGVLFFEASSGCFRFNYIPNPNPRRTIDLPCGVFLLQGVSV